MSACSTDMLSSGGVFCGCPCAPCLSAGRTQVPSWQYVLAAADDYLDKCVKYGWPLPDDAYGKFQCALQVGVGCQQSRKTGDMAEGWRKSLAHACIVHACPLHTPWP
jgi:hypothetical protein